MGMLPHWSEGIVLECSRQLRESVKMAARLCKEKVVQSLSNCVVWGSRTCGRGCWNSEQSICYGCFKTFFFFFGRRLTSYTYSALNGTIKWWPMDFFKFNDMQHKAVLAIIFNFCFYPLVFILFIHFGGSWRFALQMLFAVSGEKGLSSLDQHYSPYGLS